MKKINLGKMGYVTISIDKLKELQGELGKKYLTRVGVLGGKTTRKKGDSKHLTNADIGFIHEKGSFTRGIPQRSFLMMPLHSKLPGMINRIGKDLFKGVEEGGIIKFYRRLGATAEGVIQNAFATRGFGVWAPNSPETIRRKGSDMPLIDTAQLRKSITSTVLTT